jgi:hypothetical protein
MNGVHWAVVRRAGSTAVWVVVLGMPAVLARATVVRRYAVVRIAYGRLHSTRTFRRGIRGRG